MSDDSVLKQYLQDKAAEFVEDLKNILSIPSVSTADEHKPDMQRCAEEVVKQLHDAGITKTEIMPTPGHPIVYAESEQLPNRPTILIYGHYDVQPEDPIDEWSTPPFEPTIKDGRIYARGTSDDKGQFLVHVKAAKARIETKSLPVNLKFCIEGEEEIGSPSLAPFIAEHTDLLKSDVLVISDSTMYAPGIPALLYGLRGLSYIEVTFKGGNTDMHSGMFGGAVPNPAIELSRVIGQLIDEHGRITVPGFYDKVRPLTQAERDEWAKLPFSDEEFRQSVGCAGLCGEEGFTNIERRWARPCLDVNGLVSGFTGEGAKTVLPAKAMAKISCRLVPDQDPEEISQKLLDYIKQLAPPTIEVSGFFHHGGLPWMTDPTDPVLEAARIASEKAWNRAPVAVREGGSIPIVSAFCNLLNVPAVLMGVGLDDENIHAPNEFLRLENFHAGIAASCYLMEEIAKLPSMKK